MIPNFQNWNLEFSNDLVLISADTLSFKVNKNQTLENDYFSFNLKNDSLQIIDTEYNIQRTSLNFATSSLKKRIQALPGSKSSSAEVIDLSINGTNKLRNDATLNTLIQVVIADRIEDERQLTSATIKFIDTRLETLKNSLDKISKKTIEYQLENNIYDTEQQTSSLLSNIVKENEETFNLKIQLEIATSLLEQLNSQQNFEILPANIGILDESINELIGSYNTMVIDRNKAFKETHAKEAEEGLARLKKVAREGGNLFEVMMDIVEHCTVGQVTQALFETGGKFRRNM